MVTIVGMNVMGLPCGMLAAEHRTNPDGSVSFRKPRGRKWFNVGSESPVRVLAGDRTADVRAAVWVSSGPNAMTSRYHGFSKEWEKVIASL